MRFLSLFLIFLYAAVLNAVPVKFTYKTDNSRLAVNVAGTFNEWDKQSDNMSYNKAAGAFETTLDLAPGAYEYKFVINHSKWLLDPKRPSRKSSDGNENSVINVTLPIDLRKVKPDDGKIYKQYVRHKPGQSKFLTEYGGKVYFLLQTLKNDAAAVSIVINGAPHKMYFGGSGMYLDYYFSILPNKTKTMTYSFSVKDKKAQYRTKTFIYKAGSREFNTPEWVKTSVFYQIFPERFFNGDTTNDPYNVQPWGTSPTFSNYMGGDINGIEDKLGYLTNLGINAVYLNPVFQANSNHKYNTADYFRIDRHFGGNAAFSSFLKNAHSKGIKVILDGVFNHTGTDFYQFQDLLRAGAHSKYKDWYFVRSFPIVKNPPNYECWWGFSDLPKLNTANPKVQKFILSVADNWLKQGIDGWRLDVANEVNFDFWDKFRRRVKSDNPNAYIVGEIWGDGSRWLQGDKFDAVMNYRLRALLLSFFVYKHIGPKKFSAKLVDYYFSYPAQVQQVMFNLLSSHDIPRILTVCNGQENELAGIVKFLFFMPGAPVIYYGDEIGMTGGKDPDNRRTFIWNRAKWNFKVYNLYKKMVLYRKIFAPIYKDAYLSVIKTPKNVFGAKVYSKRGEILFFLNTGNDVATIDMAAGYRTFPDNEKIKKSLKLRTGESKICVKYLEK